MNDAISILESAARNHLGEGRFLNELTGIPRKVGIDPTGGLGDAKITAGGIGELQIHARPGYQVSYVQKDRRAVLLLRRGDKSSQTRDIRRAKRLLKDLNE